MISTEMQAVASMVIRNIPDDVIERFKAKAKSQDKSTEQMAREVITREAGMTKSEAWVRMEEIRSRSKPVDLETALRIMEESRQERDARPDLPDLDDDR